MRPIVQSVSSALGAEDLLERLRGEAMPVLLRTAAAAPGQGRYSIVTAKPFLILRATGFHCQFSGSQNTSAFGNPWRILETLLARYELVDEIDFPFPLGGCFGYWGYDLRHALEPKLTRRTIHDLDLPDAQVGFYDSLVVFDHQLQKTWIVSTGLGEDGSRDPNHARRQLSFWEHHLIGTEATETSGLPQHTGTQCRSTFSRDAFLRAVQKAQAYIRAGDIYQVNLAHRLTTAQPAAPFDFFRHLAAVSPAPFAAYIDCGDFQLLSSSPELFLRMNGRSIQTRPIKGTRPRSSDPLRDAQLAYELQTSPKETSELVMITDLLRNDLGRVCEYGSVHVPDLMRLERFAQVQHLVSTVEGHLRPELTHLAAFAACFPGGSVTGAPKIRAMEIIEELEPVARGPYTGCAGYIGFNRESQLSILIRTAIFHQGLAHFYTGAGIVADSDAAAEYDETMAKAGGFLAALQHTSKRGTLAP